VLFLYPIQPVTMNGVLTSQHQASAQMLLWCWISAANQSQLASMFLSQKRASVARVMTLTLQAHPQCTASMQQVLSWQAATHSQELPTLPGPATILKMSCTQPAAHDDWAEVDFHVPDATACNTHLASDRASSQAGVALDSSSTASWPSQQQKGHDEPSSVVSAGTAVHQQPSQSSGADAGTSGQWQYEEADAFSRPKADTAQPDDWTDNAFPEDPAIAESAVRSDVESSDADVAVCSSQQATTDNWADHSFSSDAAQPRGALSEPIQTEDSSRKAPNDAVWPAGQALVNHDWTDAAFPADIQAAASHVPHASDADTSPSQTDTAAHHGSRPNQTFTSAVPQAAEANTLTDQSSSADAHTAAGSNDTSDKAVVSVQQPEVAVDDWADQVCPEEAATATPVDVPAEQVAAEPAAADGDWGDDDFGDFNNAAEAGDDDGFGAFNEAGTEAGPSDAPAAQSPQGQLQHQQKPASPAGTWHDSCSLHDWVLASYWPAVTRLDRCLTLIYSHRSGQPGIILGFSLN